MEGTPGGGGGVKGMSTQEAERTFLKIACQLDTYGVDPHPVKVLLQNFKLRHARTKAGRVALHCRDIVIILGCY